MKINFDNYLNFKEEEVRCPCCKVVGVTEEAMSALQALRTLLRRPVRVNSAYRCPKHNEIVGGAPGSKHKEGTAFDISLNGLDRWELLRHSRKVGFKGFGFYKTFLHVDLGPSRTWGDWE